MIVVHVIQYIVNPKLDSKTVSFSYTQRRKRTVWLGLGLVPPRYIRIHMFYTIISSLMILYPLTF